jgi:hypothetical protein
MDRVQPLKMESAATGGTQTDFSPVSINHNEDYTDVRGVTFQSDSSDDEIVYIDRSNANALVFYTNNATTLEITSGADFNFSSRAFNVDSTSGVTLSGTSIEFFGAYTFPTSAGASGTVLTLSGTDLVFKDAAGGGVFEVVSNVVRAASGDVAYATDDFVFGSYQLNDAGANYDNRFFFDKSAGTFHCGGQTSTSWDTRSDYSFVWGYNCFTTGGASTGYAKAGGNACQAWVIGAVAEGYSVWTTGQYARGENYDTYARGNYSHAEGYMTTAGSTSQEANSAAHAEGYDTDATGTYGSHSEGRQTTAYGQASHAEGYLTQANGNYSHSEGRQTIAGGEASHAEGYGNASYSAASTASHVEGYYCRTASGTGNHAEGANSQASGSSACHAEGGNTLASGAYSHSEGVYTEASGQGAHAEGYGTSGNKNIASSYGAHAEGYETDATNGYGNHAEGYRSQATGTFCAHAEGHTTSSTGQSSHSEGQNSTSSGQASHSEGLYTIASGNYSHSEGQGSSGDETKAIGVASHAEGYKTIAGTATSDTAAHSEGYETEAQQAYSHSEGYYSQATKDASHAEGAYSKARYYAAHAGASGQRGSEIGSLQHEIIQCSNTSTSASDVALWPNSNSGNDLVLPVDYNYDVIVKVTGIVTTGSAPSGDSIHFTLHGAVTNDSGTATLVYCNETVEHADSSLSACDATLEASVSDSIRIIVNGIASTTIQWNATVICTETYFA